MWYILFYVFVVISHKPAVFTDARSAAIKARVKATIKAADIHVIKDFGDDASIIAFDPFSRTLKNKSLAFEGGAISTGKKMRRSTIIKMKGLLFI